MRNMVCGGSVWLKTQKVERVKTDAPLESRSIDIKFEFLNVHTKSFKVNALYHLSLCPLALLGNKDLCLSLLRTD